jgi:plasmid stability protein
MPNLSIKNVLEALAEKLRQRAAAHHRSLQSELMAQPAAAYRVTPGAAGILPAA